MNHVMIVISAGEGGGGVEVGYLTALAGRLKQCKFRLKIFNLFLMFFV